MTPQFRHITIALGIFILTVASADTYACTCIGKDKQTTENELNFVDLAVKGRVIAVTEYKYYDTASLSLANIRFDEKKWGYLIRKYKIFTLFIDTKYKTTENTSDTIKILTGYGGGDCGYEFEIGKEYIVYAEAWKEKTITVRHKKKKVKRKISETAIPNKFHTSICRLTQETNAKEIENIKRLTE